MIWPWSSLLCQSKYTRKCDLHAACIWDSRQLEHTAKKHIASSSLLLNFSDCFLCAILRGLKRPNYLLIYKTRTKNEQQWGRMKINYCSSSMFFLLCYLINHCMPPLKGVLTPNFVIMSLKYKAGLHDTCRTTFSWTYSALKALVWQF